MQSNANALRQLASNGVTLHNHGCQMFMQHWTRWLLDHLTIAVVQPYTIACALSWCTCMHVFSCKGNAFAQVAHVSDVHHCLVCTGADHTLLLFAGP